MKKNKIDFDFVLKILLYIAIMTSTDEQQTGLGWDALKKIVCWHSIKKNVSLEEALNQLEGENLYMLAESYDLYQIRITTDDSMIDVFNYVYTTPNLLDKLEDTYKREDDDDGLKFEYDCVRDDDPMRFFLAQQKDTIQTGIGGRLFYKYFMENTHIHYVNSRMVANYYDDNETKQYEIEGVEYLYETIQSSS